MRLIKSAILFFVLTFALTACAMPIGAPKPTVEPPVPASGTVLFQDDFSNPFTGWDQVTADGGVMDYDNGVYRIQVTAPDYNFWSTPGKNFTDVRIETDVAKIGGPDSNRAGLICRYQTIDSLPNFYFFIVTSDGFYGIGRTSGNQSMLIGQNEMAQSPNIKTGLAINHLRADCTGGILSFYVNGFLVGQVTDSTLQSGDVGLLAGAFKEGAVDIIFDQFVVLQP